MKLPWLRPWTSAPFSPRSSTARWSSSAAASGRTVGSMAKPAKRSGFPATMSASASFTARQASTAMSAGRRWLPGDWCERTCMSIPAASISAIRVPAKSKRRSRMLAGWLATMWPRCRASVSCMKCSSIAMTRCPCSIRLPFLCAPAPLWRGARNFSRCERLRNRRRLGPRDYESFSASQRKDAGAHSR